ncbi:hypothetical protein [Caldisalinibacter kiritimatiensis]|uniref:Iron-only hydrogenase system regulator n=1 Tax=Caldisalinibacter kiritimatiensis TaxID=1304284 RepID=R1AX01_9FIRM|nr:hypothetical protein [Caldisalinibacter kiritimatiensis]EOD01187.1 hypothetical protein L21TH_0726 [Caldisalinibacter kiritimatiensis]
MSKTIMGIQVDDRFEEVQEMQRVLTNFGDIIKTRLGLHQQQENDMFNTKKGLILLELVEDSGNRSSELEKNLEGIKNIQVRSMRFQ